ncbi:MAG: hypothetical protein AB1483_00425 [Candidatus Zixiibacteriota bacterium]
MESQKETSKNGPEVPDIGPSIFAGAIVCLAIYGGYKLLQKEANQASLMENGVNSRILDRIVEQELH